MSACDRLRACWADDPTQPSPLQVEGVHMRRLLRGMTPTLPSPFLGEGVHLMRASG